MARVHPFKGLRPRPDLVREIASPPYDVLSSDEAREIFGRQPKSFIQVVRPEVNLEPGVDLYDDRVYQAAADRLAHMVREGWLIRERRPAFYVYRLVMDGNAQVGLVAGAHADDYEKDVIKKHEFTRPQKEDDRLRHIMTLNANTGPVFLAYRSREDIDSLIMRVTERTPEYDFMAESGVQHTLWVVDDPAEVQEIERAFDGVDYLYVADGHHRSAAGTRAAKERAAKNPCHTGDEEYNYWLSVIFPDNQLRIFDYNRVVKDLAGLSKEEFLAKVAEKFEVEKTGRKKPSKRREIGMYLDGEWYTLTVKPGTFPEDDPVDSLDVAILQNNLLSPVLGISDPRRDSRIDFVGGIRGPEELERRVDGGWAVAFTMYPTSMDELMAIADAGRTMPPKSTWFEPKLLSGMVVHSLD